MPTAENMENARNFFGRMEFEREVKNMGVRMENVGGVVRMDPILHDAAASLPPSGQQGYKLEDVQPSYVQVSRSSSGRMVLSKSNMVEAEKQSLLGICEQQRADVAAQSVEYLRDVLALNSDGTEDPVPPSTRRKAEILREICDEEIATFIKKNTDYGDSFANLRRTLPNAVLVRIYDKWSRLASLMNSGDAPLVEESIDDTLADLANYANMELLERRLERMV